MDYRAGEPFDDDDLTRRGYERTLYDYELPDGTLVNQKCRYEVPKHKLRPGVDAPKKKFLVRRPADDRYDRTYDIGRCIFGAGKRRVIYGWPAIMKAGPGTTVFVTEGEKNADDLIKAGYLATTTLDGQWPSECAAALTGYHLIILEDHDEEGRSKAANAQRHLAPVARSTRIITAEHLWKFLPTPKPPPPTADISDWLEEGGDPTKLLEICGEVPTEQLVTWINPADWQGKPVPERIFLVPPLIPDENVTLMYGDGGLGKSLLAMGLAVARSARRDWLGLETLPGRTLVLSAEDDRRELQRRCDDWCRHYDIPMSALGDILLGDLVEHDSVIGELARNGRIVATELYHVMINMIIQFAPSLVIVDALADSFAGDENNRAQARQFISMLRRPAIKHHCAFLALAHPSLSGITTGRGTSGTTGWSNSVRARTYLETFQVQDKEPDPNLKILRQHKANYAAPGFELLLSYQNGVLAPVVSDAPLSQLEKTLQAEQVFMTILKRLFQDGRYVGPSPGVNYAPAVFADEPEANMISKDRLKRAMISLFEKKRIIMEPYGEKSRGKKRIAEAPF